MRKLYLFLLNLFFVMNCFHAQASLTDAEKIYRVTQYLKVVDSKDAALRAETIRKDEKEYYEGYLTQAEKASLPLWKVKYLNKLLVDLEVKTQAECDRDLQSVQNEMTFGCLLWLCYRKRTDECVVQQVRDYLAQLENE